MAELEMAIERLEADIRSDSREGQTWANDLRLILAANRKMRAGLRPFAALADMVGEAWTDETPAFVGADGVTITIGQLREARSALSTKED